MLGITSTDFAKFGIEPRIKSRLVSDAGLRSDLHLALGQSKLIYHADESSGIYRVIVSIDLLVYPVCVR